MLLFKTDTLCSGNVTCHHKNCTESQTHVSIYLYYRKYSASNPNAIYREIFRSKYEIPVWKYDVP